MTPHVGLDQDQMTSQQMISSWHHRVPHYVIPPHFAGLNDVIINLQITSRLPFGFTQLATQGDLKDKIQTPFCVKMGSIYVNRDITNTSQITSNITFPVSKSRHMSGIVLKRDNKYTATAHARLSQIVLTCQQVVT